jgi:uncharacterized protein with FMN-binding domain
MRRSTAAAVGTLTGAALIVGVRLSVAAPVVTAAPPSLDLADSGASPGPAASASKSPSSKKPTTKKPSASTAASGGAGGGSGLTAGTFKGKAVVNPYGTVQVQIKVEDGKITAVAATYPLTSNSATINPPAVATLKSETLKAQSADIDAASGATFTSKSYIESLQAALDAAKA